MTIFGISYRSKSIDDLALENFREKDPTNG
jgi:hypothetical protein